MSWAVQPVVQVLVEVGYGHAVGEFRVAVATLAEVLLRAVDHEEAGVGASGFPGDLEDCQDPVGLDYLISPRWPAGIIAG